MQVPFLRALKYAATCVIENNYIYNQDHWGCKYHYTEKAFSSMDLLQVLKYAITGVFETTILIIRTIGDASTFILTWLFLGLDLLQVLEYAITGVIEDSHIYNQNNWVCKYPSDRPFFSKHGIAASIEISNNRCY